MTETITVKGVGKVTTQADYMTMLLTISELNADYDRALDAALRRVEAMRKALTDVEAADELKLQKFDVEVQQQDGKDCFCCVYQYKLAFDFDHARLSAILSAVAKSGAMPETQMAFTVKHPQWLQRQMLFNAAANAKEKAEILCRATGSRLGRLLEMQAETNRGGIQPRFRSRTKADFNRVIQRRSNIPMEMVTAVLPEDVEETESVSFTWEIL